MIDTFVFDVDGTLVDTNYHHAVAWYRAFRRYDVTPAIWRIRRAIGMGGDQLVEAVAGKQVEDEHGDDVRSAWTGEFDKFLPEVQPFEGAELLLEDIRKRDLKLVLASSGESKHVDHYLDLLNGRKLAEAWTTSEDAEETKPAPDLVETAMAKVEGVNSVMIGDSTWDAKAAKRAGLPTYAVRTGGFSVEELLEAGAVSVYDSLEDLQADLDAIISADLGDRI
ncbi:MAG: HAD family hydrolase [Propionibacteriales bacterium]|nr:HAD family hydrolase [Propionibacteriales bacterium]